MTNKGLLIVGMLAAAAAVVAGVLWVRAGESVTWDRAEVSEDGLVVTLRYLGGECEQFRSVHVEESQAAAEMTITTRSFATSCSDIGIPRIATAHLDTPLGDRELVDGSRSE